MWVDRIPPCRRLNMDYNTEKITNIAAQVAETIRLALAQHIQAGETGVTIAQVETEFRQCLRQVGMQALSQFLSTAKGTPEAEIPCVCGGTLHYQRQRLATITTVFGRLTYERAYYAGCTCGQGKDRKSTRLNSSHGH